MVDQVQEYLTFRRALGYELGTHGKELMSFARYADKIGHHRTVTTTLATQWAKQPENAHPSYWARRLHIVRQFAKYAALYNETTEIPPADIFGPMKRRPTPHIYSQEQINELLQTASRMEPQDSLLPRTYVTLFGLLVSTGLRISEALALTSESVDLEKGVLHIQQTKFRKDRLVPVHASTLGVLRCYHCTAEAYRVKTHSRAFFLDEKAKPLNYRGVLYRFIKIRNGLGWCTLPSDRPPRLHDLRHTFTVRRLLKWYQDGCSIDEYIVYLSTYLGHVCVSDTYWYLTAVPELMDLASKHFYRFVYQQGGRES